MVDTISSTATLARSSAFDGRSAGVSSGSLGAGASSRAAGDFASGAQSGSADDNPVTKVLEKYRTVPYLSPRLRVDDAVNRVIIEYRNPDTGDVERQFPSRQQIKKYEQAERERASVEDSARQAAATGTPSAAAATGAEKPSAAPAPATPARLTLIANAPAAPVETSKPAPTPSPSAAPASRGVIA